MQGGGFLSLSTYSAQTFLSSCSTPPHPSLPLPHPPLHPSRSLSVSGALEFLRRFSEAFDSLLIRMTGAADPARSAGAADVGTASADRPVAMGTVGRAGAGEPCSSRETA